MKNYFFDFFVNTIISSRIWFYFVRKLLYRIFNIKIRKCSVIHSGCYFSGTRFSIGNKSYINRNCLIDCKHGDVVIGDNTGIAYNVSIYTTQHDFSNPLKRTGKVYVDNVIIGNGVWIGGNVIILPGMSIGDGCIIAA